MYIYVCVIEFSGNYLQSQLLLISYNFHNFYFLNANHTHTNNTHKRTNEHIVKHKKGQPSKNISKRFKYVECRLCVRSIAKFKQKTIISVLIRNCRHMYVKIYGCDLK